MASAQGRCPELSVWGTHHHESEGDGPAEAAPRSATARWRSRQATGPPARTARRRAAPKRHGPGPPSAVPRSVCSCTIAAARPRPLAAVRRLTAHEADIHQPERRPDRLLPRRGRIPRAVRAGERVDRVGVAPGEVRGGAGEVEVLGSQAAYQVRGRKRLGAGPHRRSANIARASLVRPRLSVATSQTARRIGPSHRRAYPPEFYTRGRPGPPIALAETACAPGA
jgi:hypothetical protein